MGVVASPEVDSLLRALAAQENAPRLRVVIADSGADAHVSATVQAWVRATAVDAVVVQAPTSVMGARNAILDAVTTDEHRGWWVTFPEGPDTFASDYLARMAQVLSPEFCVASARQHQYRPETGRARRHVQLDGPFEDGGAVKVDLARSPEMFPIVMRTAFIALDVISDAGLRFDPELEHGFGDLDLLCRALLAAPSPTAVFADVEYLFTERDDVSTAGRSYFAHEPKFTTVLEVGHLGLLDAADDGQGVAEFVQHAVLFDLGWYFRGDEAPSSQMNAEMHGVDARFHALVAAILARVDLHVLEGLSPRRLPIDRYVAWRYGYSAVDWHGSPVLLTELDSRRRLVCLSYHYVGQLPRETVLLDGRASEPVYAKSRDVIYAGRTLARERILWVSAGPRLELSLDGVPVALGRTRPQREHTRWSPHELKAVLSGPPASTSSASTVTEVASRYLNLTRVRSWVIRSLAKAGPVRARYAGSWVLMDRVDSAHDNAEHLFKHMRAADPDRRVWFALDRTSRDYRRLKREGVGHLLAYGSLRWMLVCLNATHVVSSQAGPYVDSPQSLRSIQRLRWRFVFLQHGVVHTGLHRWLNRRSFDLFLTSTSDEYAAIVGDGSPYRFTPREVALTGMPRFDRLMRLAADVSDRSAIVVAPTWRESLFSSGADARGLRDERDDFAETEYASQWRAFLTSSELRDVARASGKRIDFMPHPNIKPYLDQFGLPDDVNVLSYETHDIQRVLADAAVLVTDYSSIAFDAAFIARPVVYFQFDRSDVFRGSHTTRQGYYSYDDDGFGRVVKSADEAVAAVQELADGSFEVPVEYQRRMDAAFPFRDDGACQRVIDAVAALDRPVTARSASAIPQAPPPRPSPRD